MRVRLKISELREKYSEGDVSDVHGYETPRSEHEIYQPTKKHSDIVVVEPKLLWDLPLDTELEAERVTVDSTHHLLLKNLVVEVSTNP